MNPKQLDEKSNLVIVCLFETYLAKFILEHPEFYQEIYTKALDRIQHILLTDFIDNPQLNQSVDSKKTNYDLHRHIYTIFSQLHGNYREQSSFDSLKREFNLSAADYFIKLIIDNFLTPPPVLNVTPTSRLSMFSVEPRRSPFKPSRSPLFFSEDNRGVLEIFSDSDEYEEITTHSIGIVSQYFTPSDLTSYFNIPVSSARFNYEPNETSYVAQWLRCRNLPVISGSSGSTEGLINLLFPFLDLTKEEKEIMIFAQACNMVANGHHSFFEAMMIANHLRFFNVTDKDNLLDFYLQCVPEPIRSHPEFIELLKSSPMQSLLDGFKVLDELKQEQTVASIESEDLDVASIWTIPFLKVVS